MGPEGLASPMKMPIAPHKTADEKLRTVVSQKLFLAERDVALWGEHSLMVRWVVGSILDGERIELFLVPASAPRLV